MQFPGKTPARPVLPGVSRGSLLSHSSSNILLAFVLIATTGVRPALGFCTALGGGQQDIESHQSSNPGHSTAKHKLVEKIVPAVPIWTAISHNPLILALRFHGVTKALRKEVSIGDLKMRGFGKDAKIKLAGTRKIDGETLPFVSIRYPREGVAAGGAGVELANMQGKIKSLTLDLAIRVPKRSDHKLVFAYLDPGHFNLDVDTITGSESTSFGDPIPFSVGETVVTNTVPIESKRSTPNSALRATGELRLDGADLDFKQVALSFSGENNVLTLAGQVSMPNQITWGYEMLDRRLVWKAGQLEIKNLSLAPQPAHQINFGGIALSLKGIKLDSASFTKSEFPADALPSASLTGLAVDASDINYKNSTLTGALTAPITIKQIDAQVNITNIFEGINLSNQRLQGMHISLANISYQNGNGLQVQGQNLDISVSKYTSNTVEGSSTPDTNVTASIVLNNAPITQQDGGSFVIDTLSADLQGPTDKLNGRGTLSGTLSKAAINVGIDMSGMFGKCQNKVGLQVSQLSSAWVQANINIFNGEPSGEATVPHIELALRPDYWRCDWDDPSIGFNLPGIHVGWDGIWLTPDGPRVDIGSIHWTAEFIPLTGAVGELALAEIRFDKGGAKICGGHTLAVGSFWTPSIGPNFPDCGAWWCNIPRDIVSGMFGFFEAPAGLFLNEAALGIINTVGLFDAGIFQNKCQ